MQVCMPFSPLASLKAFSIVMKLLQNAAVMIECPGTLWYQLRNKYQVLNSNLSCCFDDISSSRGVNVVHFIKSIKCSRDKDSRMNYRIHTLEGTSESIKVQHVHLDEAVCIGVGSLRSKCTSKHKYMILISFKKFIDQMIAKESSSPITAYTRFLSSLSA